MHRLYSHTVTWIGQGDHGLQYDVSLVCPLLLVSRIVILNWPGRPAKNVILEKLFVMAHAASLVADGDGRSSTAIFGHLHLVFRDMDNINGIEELILTEEHGDSSEISDRNSTRQLLKKIFQSISIWGLPAPVDSNKALQRGDFKLADVTDEFKTELAKLKSCMHSQITTSESKTPLNGREINDLVLAAANIINSGTGSKISPQSIVEQSQREWLKAEASAMIPVLKQQLQKISSALCDPDECVQKCERAVQSIVSEFFDYNASQYSAHLLEESGERIHKEGHELALAVAEQNKQAVQKVIAAVINEFDTYVATNFHDLWMQKLKQNGPIPGSSDAEEEETLNSIHSASRVTEIECVDRAP
jgi:hypothetical protein